MADTGLHLTSIRKRDTDQTGLQDGTGSVPPGQNQLYMYDNRGFDGTVPTVSNSVNSEQRTQEANDYDIVGRRSPNRCMEGIQFVQDAITNFFRKRKREIKWAILSILLIFYAVYFGFAMHHRFGDEGSVRLLWVTCVAVFLIIVTVIKRYFGATIYTKVLEPIRNAILARFTIFKWLFITVVVILVIVFIGVDIAPNSPYNLVSISGVAVIVLVLFVFSHDPSAVRWRPVLWGLGIQFALALIIMRTNPGYTAFRWLGARVREFLEYVNAGARFVFGPSYMDHSFAFKVLPTIIFFSAMVSLLYYLGVMQIVVQKLGWLMQVTMGTTHGESLNAAGNIFLGQTEAPLLVRPLLPDMTTSELFAVITGGYASIAGTVMASFILFGVPAHHLLTASVMSAPAALAMAKLFYPETEETKKNRDVHLEKSPYRNFIEALCNGAIGAISLVANIAANLIAFLSALAFVNATLSWFGARVGIEPPNYPPLTFQLICSYVFWPLSFLMGVLVQDCRKVAELIGVKIFLNEFVAYRQLGIIINNTNVFYNYTQGEYTSPYCINNDRDRIFLPDTNTTLVGGLLQERSQSISTYALCGFANIGSLGIALGGIGAMIPERRNVLAKIVVRALIAGNCADFLTACLAGLLFRAQNPYPSNVSIPC